MDVRILGPLAIEVDGLALPLPTGRATTTLATLALHAGRPVSRDLLVEAAWDDRPPRTAVTQLHAHISVLRRRLPANTIQTRGSGYLLQVGPRELDLERFLAHLARAREVPPPQALDEYRSALLLWRGTPLDGIRSRYLESEAVGLRSIYLSAVDETARLELDLDQPHSAVRRLQPLLAEEPTHEPACGLLMKALHRCGRRAEALQVFRRTRATLVRELGVEPGPELQELHLQLLRTETDPDPENVAGAPPAAPGDVPPIAQLPTSPADFTGRDREVRELSRELVPDCPAETVVIRHIRGGGGIGKTALALRVAHQIRSSFPDGQLYADLRGTSDTPVDPGHVLGGWLRALGVAADQVPAAAEERASLLRTRLAGRRMLVLLDDAADSAQVRPLLPGTGGCVVLITGRRTLADLPGRTMVLGLLGDTDAHRLLERIVGQHRLDAEAAATAAILAACGGLPLAIRIAGTRLAARPTWTVAELARRLENHHRILDELATGNLAVRAAFQRSYDALSAGGTHRASAATTFLRLGLAQADTIGVPAAAALTGLSELDTERALETLVDSHLLESPAAGRYRMHELVRVFAAELATRAVAAPARTR